MDVPVVTKRCLKMVKLVITLHHGSLKVVEFIIKYHYRNLEE